MAALRSRLVRQSGCRKRVMQCRRQGAGIISEVFCPSCHGDDTKVVDSRVADEGTAIRRRRQCLSCAHRFTTFERVDHVPLSVDKSHGGSEPFDRQKLIAGLNAATKGRSVSDPSLEEIATRIEDSMRLLGSSVTSANRR